MNSPDRCEKCAEGISYLETPRGDRLDLIFVPTHVGSVQEVSVAQKEVIESNGVMFMNTLNTDTAIFRGPIAVRNVLSGYMESQFGKHLGVVIGDNTKKIVIPTNSYGGVLETRRLPLHINPDFNGKYNSYYAEILQLVAGLTPGLALGIMEILKKYNRIKPPKSEPVVDQEQTVLSRRNFLRAGALAIAGISAIPLIVRINLHEPSDLVRNGRALAKQIFPYTTRDFIGDIQRMSFTLKTLKMIEKWRTDSNEPADYTLLLTEYDEFVQVLLEQYQDGRLTLREMEDDFNQLLSAFKQSPMSADLSGVDNHLNLVIRSAFAGSDGSYLPIGEVVGDPFYYEIETKKPAAPIKVKPASS